MNILQVLNSGNPGGMEQHVLDLVTGLRSKGHNVWVVCNSGEIVDWYKKAGAEVIIDSIKFEIDPSYILRLVALIKKNKISAIHSHELKASSNALLAGFLSGIKTRITHIHTPISEWQIPNKLKQIYTFLTIKGYATIINLFATYEIALTKTRLRVKLKEGLRPDKLKVIPNGLDLDRFDIPQEQKEQHKFYIRQKYNIPQDAFVIGNVSRMTDEKGHKVLIRGFKEFFDVVSMEDPANKYYLLLAGGGKLEEEILAMVVQYKLIDRVTITGVFPEEDLIKYYSAFDLFVFPSLAEGFGYVMVEAMYMRVPSIVSDLEVLKEVSGGSLVYFKTGNYVDLADKIKFMCNKLNFGEEVSSQYIENPHDIVAFNYSMEKFISSYEKLYLGELN